jgi:tRNA U38,U39,U40 pseudouridine synthase TruA
MVRTLVGTMLEQSPEQLGYLLNGASRDQAGSTAPAHGLYLERVEY